MPNVRAFSRLCDGDKRVFRVKAILDRLKKAETSVKFAPELLYYTL